MFYNTWLNRTDNNTLNMTMHAHLQISYEISHINTSKVDI